MAQRIIHRDEHVSAGTFGEITHACRVYRDSEYDEYNVRFYVNGVEVRDSRYFASDKQDALDTLAHHMQIIRATK
jgi:hypothetical protein